MRCNYRANTGKTVPWERSIQLFTRVLGELVQTPSHAEICGFSSPSPKMVEFEAMILYTHHIYSVWVSVFRSSVRAVLELLSASF